MKAKDAWVDRRAAGMAIGALGSLAAAAVLVGVRGEVVNANVALVLVLFVFAGAVTGGRAAGGVAALVAAMSFDFFHTKPYGTLKIASSDDLQTTILLLVVGLAAGEVAVWLQRLQDRLKVHGDEIRRMHRVAELAAGGETPEDLELTVTAELLDAMRLRDCWFERPPYVNELPTLERSGVVRTTHHRYTRDGFELPREGVALPVIGPGGPVGRFVLMPEPGAGVSKEGRLLAVALADQLGMALSPRQAS